MAKIFNIPKKRRRFKKPKIKNDKSQPKRKKRILSKFKLIRKDPFGNVILLKRALVGVLGAFTYGRFNLINNLKVDGADHLLKLPKNNVLFISNHQTYYADVMAMYHVFCSVKWKLKHINFPFYLLAPRANAYFIAAEETMKESGFLPKILSYTGAVTVRRSWRYKGEKVKRGADVRAPEKIKKALEFGWVVTFPQGTTRAFAPIRKGAGNIIKSYNPVVVPVEIDGFRRAFDRKGLFFKKRGVKLHLKFKQPVRFKKEATLDDIKAFLEANIIDKKDVSDWDILEKV